MSLFKTYQFEWDLVLKVLFCVNLLACINEIKSSYCVPLAINLFSEIWFLPFTTKQFRVFSTKLPFKPQKPQLV